MQAQASVSAETGFSSDTSDAGSAPESTPPSDDPGQPILPSVPFTSGGGLLLGLPPALADLGAPSVVSGLGVGLEAGLETGVSALAAGPGGPQTCIGEARSFVGYYNLGGRLLSEYAGYYGAELKGNYVYANGVRVAHLKTGAVDTRYYLNDHQGSPVMTITGAGAVRNKTLFTPYGREFSATIADDERFGYTGHYRDDELQVPWNYLGARYYDPELRRFTQIDPLAEKYPNWSPYAYTLDNPVKYVDPDGRWVETALDAISFVASAHAFFQDPGWGNAAAVVYDAAAVVIPALPATGTVRAGVKLLDAATSTAKTTGAAADANKTFQVYEKPGPGTGKPYVGRTSGTGTPEQNVGARDKTHELNKEGYGEAKVVSSSSSKDAIRGQEQRKIDQHGGAQRQGGTSANKIRAVDPKNPNANRYRAAAEREFGIDPKP